jgi:hypothetical protein
LLFTYSFLIILLLLLPVSLSFQLPVCDFLST